MATEGVTLDVHRRRDRRALRSSRPIVNERTENIGARRLHTVMERLLDEISFEAPDLAEQVDDDRRRVRATACSPTS